MRRRRLPLTFALVLCASAVAGAACGGSGAADKSASPAGANPMTLDERMDPQSCAGCHPDAYREWSGSMHAYASEDPLFVAMNRRAQRETGGTNGSFCVRCHAPVALASGATADGANLAELPPKLRGVTCFFCHSADSVGDVHDGARLAADGVLRGGIDSPQTNARHASAYSPLHDRGRVESAALCGSCHDVRTPAGVEVETTFSEWRASRFAHDEAGGIRTCGACHMPAIHAPAAAVANAPLRSVHDHRMAAVDLALSPFPESEDQRKSVQTNLGPAIEARLCVLAAGAIEVTLANTRIGHAWPTGASHDRRAWLEVVAYAAGSVVFSSGAVADGDAPEPPLDPTLLLFRETLLDARGIESPFMWQASTTRARTLAPGASTLARFSAPAETDRVTARVRLAPFAPSIVDALVASGDLDPAVRAKVPSFALTGTMLEWTKERGFACLP